MIWLILLLLVACGQPTVSFGDAIFYVEIADSPDEWSQGLMHRDSLGSQEGMFFVFPDAAQRSFWMKNTLIPLDIVFLDEGLEVINVESAVPCVEDPCAHYLSDAPAKYVLEINAGLAKKYGIAKGEILRK